MVDSAIVEVPVVWIVVVNWNGVDDTVKCLDSLKSLTYPNFRVVVVDNGSTDDSMIHLRRFEARNALRVLETGKNLGFAEGNNVGVRYALEHGADYVLLLNNDTVVSPDLLDVLVASASRRPDVGVFSARILYASQPDIVWFDGAWWNAASLAMKWPGQGQPESALSDEEHETAYACGAGLFLRSEVVRQIGLLDDRFFLVWEEVDWCYRAREAGWRSVVVPKAKIWHKIGISFGGEDSPLRTYFSVRNKLLWFQLHVPLAGRLRLWARTFPRVIPKFDMRRIEGVGVGKRLLWATQDFAQSLRGRGRRFTYLATRQAILDYLAGRFGDCPQTVREWSSAWAAQRKC